MKTILIKEVHHRVKNNLQILNSFLNLERFHKHNPEEIIRATKTRIGSLALIHEKTYNSENLEYINVKDFIKDIDSKLFYVFGSKDIEFVISIDSDIALASINSTYFNY